MDRLLDEARTGPFYLRLPGVADQVMEAVLYNASILGHYELHTFVAMPNHVHILVTAAVPLPILTKVAEGHHRETGQRGSGPNRQAVLAGGKLAITWSETKGNSRGFGVI